MYQNIKDNQQETDKWLNKISPEIGNYIAGFSDGEGSFNISIRKHPGYKLGWKTSLTFNVAQKGNQSLKLFERIFQCGYLRRRKDDLHYFEVVELEKIILRIIPFFEKFSLRSEKKNDFEIFKKVTKLMRNGSHLTKKGIIEILELRKPMNYGGKNRRIKSEDIIKSLSGSSETIRQTPIAKLEMI